MDGTTLKVPSANQTSDLVRPSITNLSTRIRIRSAPGPESNSRKFENLSGKSKLRSVGGGGKVCSTMRLVDGDGECDAEKTSLARL